MSLFSWSGGIPAFIAIYIIASCIDVIYTSFHVIPTDLSDFDILQNLTTHTVTECYMKFSEQQQNSCYKIYFETTGDEEEKPIRCSLLQKRREKDYAERRLWRDCVVEFHSERVGITAERITKLDSWEDCNAMCSRDCSCKVWTFRDDSRQCLFFNRDVSTTQHVESSITGIPCVRGNCKIHRNRNFFTYNMLKVINNIKTWRECSKKCAENPECMIWNYVTSEEKCLLKADYASIKIADGIIGGNRSCGTINH